MLMGTQWYILFNVIAGASAIPQDLDYTTQLLQVKGWERWRTLILPALFPYLITGMITAGGGAWNASIVAEYVNFGGQTISTVEHRRAHRRSHSQRQLRAAARRNAYTRPDGRRHQSLFLAAAVRGGGNEISDGMTASRVE